ncbi:MAG: ATP-binding protein [Methylocystis sp.]|uniref:ATP-binding protein n=1 Tax=Methylocystis sp. TaxID=1911079 RepID=UPI003DA24FA0
MQIFRPASMIGGVASVVVQRPLSAVFDFTALRFFENYPRWCPQVVEFELLQPGTAKAGMKVRQTTVDRGIRTVSKFEIESVTPPKAICLKGLTEPFTACYDFEKQTEESTLVSFRIQFEERRFFMRPFRQSLHESLNKGARRTVENLKQALESDYAAASTSEPLARFIYVTSLDLQEPLRKIEAFSGLLENALASSNKADMIYAQEAMRSYAATARKLVDDLLTYSGAVMGGLHLEKLDIRTEIDALLRELHGAISETGSAVTVKLPSVRFKADRSQFACLLRNILINAIRFRKEGEGAKISIEADAGEDGDLRLEITDKGVGFDEEFAKAVFEPLRPVPNKVEYPGNGIELAICKSIADRHGWEIRVKAKPGQGAAFEFKIPLVDPRVSTPAERSVVPRPRPPDEGRRYAVDHEGPVAPGLLDEDC